MCGILGHISSTKISKKKFNDTLKLIVHRGPDNLSSIFETIQNKEIALGNTRLSINAKKTSIKYSNLKL